MTNSDDIQAAAELSLFGQRVKMASTVPELHLSTPLTLPAPPPAPRPPPRRTQADFPTQDDDLRVAVERLRAGCGCCLRQVVFASRVCRPRRPRRARRPLPCGRGHGHCAAERRHVDHKGI
jgi:hypothetical protein